MKRFEHTSVVALSIVFLLSPLSVRADDGLRTLYIFDEPAYASYPFFQLTVEAGLWNSRFALSLLQSGISLELESWAGAYIASAAPFEATSTTDTEDVLNWMRDSPWVAAVRGEADVVVMVVKQLKDKQDSAGNVGTTCGTAYKTPLSVSTAHKNTHAFIAIVDRTECEDNADVIFSHELGHVLYMEHEVDENNNSFAPDPQNHGVWAVPSTIMAGRSSAALINKFSSGENPAANVTNFMTTPSLGPKLNPWETVAKYRRPTQSDPWMPNCQVIVERTDGLPCNLPNLFTTVSAHLPGYTITNIDIDYQNGISGPWNDLYEGDYSCPGLIASIVRRFRLLVETTQGLSACEIVVDPANLPVPNCGGSGPGGGGGFE